MGTKEKVKVWWAGSDGRADGMGVNTCVCIPVPSPFVMNGIMLRFRIIIMQHLCQDQNHNWNIIQIFKPHPLDRD